MMECVKIVEKTQSLREELVKIVDVLFQLHMRKKNIMIPKVFLILKSVNHVEKIKIQAETVMDLVLDQNVVDSLVDSLDYKGR